MASLFSLQRRRALAKENTEKNDASLQLPSQFELADWTIPNLRNLPHVYAHVGSVAGFSVFFPLWQASDQFFGTIRGSHYCKWIHMTDLRSVTCIHQRMCCVHCYCTRA